MNEEKKRPEEPKGKKAPFTLKNMFYHNTFVLVFSFVVAVVAWFIMSANSVARNVVIHDVPIQANVSSAAQEEGLQIFNMSYNTADVEVSGNNLLTSRLAADDFEVSVTLNPTSTKVAGNTLQKMTLQVRAVKTNSMGSYEIASVSPEEVTVEYDRSREVTFPIENYIQYSSADGYYAGTPVLSADNVTISGPESAVNRISHVAVSYNVENALRQDANFTCPIRLYDQNNQEITDTSGMYLTMNVDTIDVTIPVTPVKTVSLTASTLHQPKGFSEDRVQISPPEITIAGTSDVLSGISEIQLDTIIDFAQLDVNGTNVFTSDIALPSGVRNISAVGDAASQATVTINLNGYEEASVTASAANIQLVNAPAGAQLATSSLPVSVVGPEAQVTRLTGSEVSIQVDLSNFQERTGTVEVPVTVTLTGTAADSCWVMGEYTVSVNFSGSTVQAAVARTFAAEEDESDNLAATPQE